MFKLLAKGVKSLAAGRAQADLGMQSPHLPGAIVRVGRFLYVSSALWIGGAWYTGFVNARTQPGSGPQLVLGGPKIGDVARPDRTARFGSKAPSATTVTHDNASAGSDSRSYVTTPDKSGRQLIAISPDQLGVPGTAAAGYLWSAANDKKQVPQFNRMTYNSLLPVASSIARQFGLHVTSGYRPQSTGSLHAAGLAFDMVGSMVQMKRAATWAASNPALFQEIFVHNEGSGMHLHLGFYPDAAGIFNSAQNKYVRPTQRPQPLPSGTPEGHTGRPVRAR